ncbi:DUF3299 domain-containing protein [Thalassotalea psychrophila]|uniref:DUF3299 domain-containing protein n=1 Tax=Thalassotalea psychrophila TaxID=3065647 RepID=A0ABY9TX13_9GAMM|nr:DUF3299 domain-containing protein [Colwelliaceae bacterium SQ149]
MKNILSLFSIVAVLFSTVAFATDVTSNESKQIDWSTLNEHVQVKEIANPFENLEIEQIRMLQQVAIVDDITASGQEIDAESKKLADTARKTLADQGIDIKSMFKIREEIITQREQEFQSTNPALDNQNIEMSGFLLPLEFEGKKIKEFLLVPYVGACIHEPPPAPNQIVYAKLKTPVEPPSLSMFTAIKVNGLMKSELVSPELNLVDGAKQIPTSYTLTVDSVEFIEPNK